MLAVFRYESPRIVVALECSSAGRNSNSRFSECARRKFQIGPILLPLLHASFLPDLREGHFVLHAYAVPGTLDSSDCARAVGGRKMKVAEHITGQIKSIHLGKFRLFVAGTI